VPSDDELARTMPWLLDELCVELGLCLPPEQRLQVLNQPVVNVDELTDAVLVAEGIDPALERTLRRQVRAKIESRIGGLL
jgi:hypothetical protein